MAQASKVANPTDGQLNKENVFFSMSPFAPENLVSRDGFGSPVPRQPAYLHTQAESGAYLRDSSRFPHIYIYIYYCVIFEARRLVLSVENTETHSSDMLRYHYIFGGALNVYSPGGEQGPPRSAKGACGHL